MKELLKTIISPYKTYRRSLEREKELRQRDSLNSSDLDKKQQVLVTERDLNEILEEYIDSGKARSVKIEFPAEYKSIAEKYLNKQEIEYVVLDETHILIKG